MVVQAVDDVLTLTVTVLVVIMFLTYMYNLIKWRK